MKKFLSFILSIFLLSSCSTGINREDFHVFGFDDFTIAVAYDDVEFMRLVFDVRIKDTLQAQERIDDVEVFFWDKFFATVSIENPGKKEVPVEKGIVKKLTIYLDNIPERVYKLDGIVLSKSVRENCDTFHGEYVERNGYACVFGKNVHGKDSIVTLYGDILGFDQDELSHLEIYVK